MNEDQKLWFKAKRYGWGWTPCSWEGWTAVGVYVVAVIYEFLTIDAGSHSVSDTLINFIPSVILFTIVLIVVAFVKGEKPEWRWGDKKNSK